jgi:YfiH family protein
MTERIAEQPVGDQLVPRMALVSWQERFGVVAGVTVPGAASDGFDLGLWSGAPVGQVMSRWRALRRALPDFGGTVLGHQVHGTTVLWHDGGAGWVQLDGADGHATAAPGLLLTVTVADCIPVYLALPGKNGAARGIALLHAGWRGTAAGILATGVELLTRRLGCSPEDLVMHCGIGICGGCYEVGSEVMTGCGLPADGAGPWHVDLRERLADQGATLGLGEVTLSPWCTAHDRPQFYSHRRSGGAPGRMVAYLGIPSGNRGAQPRVDSTDGRM